ncbi:VOC family protein [Kitasatospora sp. NBC_01266]|uniref:VOC family protein n=1 Tax=Kitasatospora sp. NBC_01266 TaxID=2903572 RepID=UPI002E381893|nr:VOC family protein [Kitasatospora sp. NBC_01266]
MTRPAFHLAIPVDDLAAARAFYGGLLGLTEGRSTDGWVDWDCHGHQVVTHLVPGVRSQAAGYGTVDGHRVPVPHFGLVLGVEEFRSLARRLADAGTGFVIEPCLRYAGKPAEQWTMFLLDPAGNALEFKAFRDEAQLFAR